MKTKIGLWMLALAFPASCAAQLVAIDYKSDEFARFKGSKTYVGLSGNEAFDKELMAAMNEFWKVTPFEPIDKKGFEAKLPDKAASFIFLVIIPTKYPNQNYHYLALVNGGKKNIKKYQYDDMLAYCPINHFQNEPEMTDCSYRVRNMIQGMVQAIDIVQKKDIKGNPKKIVDGLREEYNKKAPGIKKRTLLFCQETLGSKMTKTQLAGLYPYPFEICDKDKIAQVIRDGSTEYYYYQPGITLNKSMFVIDPSNGEVVYFDYQVMGLNINEKNIKSLAAAIGGK